jgi:hypothetical protein
MGLVTDKASPIKLSTFGNRYPDFYGILKFYLWHPKHLL